MLEKIVIGLGAAGLGLVLIRYLGTTFLDSNQKKLEKKVGDNEKKVAGIEGEQRQEDKETQEQVKEIGKEQSKNVSNTELVDFFNNRK